MRKGGRFDEAIAAYQRLLAIKPDLPDKLVQSRPGCNAGRGLSRIPLASYQRALDLGVREPEEVHLNRAVIYADHLHQPEKAEREMTPLSRKTPLTLRRCSTLATFARTWVTAPARDGL